MILNVHGLRFLICFHVEGEDLEQPSINKGWKNFKETLEKRRRSQKKAKRDQTEFNGSQMEPRWNHRELRESEREAKESQTKSKRMRKEAKRRLRGIERGFEADGNDWKRGGLAEGAVAVLDYFKPYILLYNRLYKIY